MRPIRLEPLRPLGLGPVAVAVGNFDGVHRGHQVLVSEALSAARGGAGGALVLTFDPHPSRVLSPDRAPSTLMTLEQRLEALGRAGADRVAVLPFDRELAQRSPAAFARAVLRDALSAKVVVVGEHFRFGHERSGDLAALRALGDELGFSVQGIPPVLYQGVPISSTRIREALARGAVRSVSEMAGRPYLVEGRVVAGAGRGRALGIPTANLEPLNELLPCRGVYAGRCRRRDGAAGPWRAVFNVGHRPTFGAGEVVLEAHLLDFDGDLYGATLYAEFVERVRDEQRFEGPEPLARQIRRDIEKARELMS